MSDRKWRNELHARPCASPIGASWECEIRTLADGVVAVTYAEDRAVAELRAANIVRAVEAHGEIFEVCRLLADRECEGIGEEEPCLVCMATAIVDRVEGR